MNVCTSALDVVRVSISAPMAKWSRYDQSPTHDTPIRCGRRCDGPSARGHAEAITELSSRELSMIGVETYDAEREAVVTRFEEWGASRPPRSMT